MSKVLLYELGKSISFGRLPLLAKVLWPMLLAASDNQGRGIAEPDVIKWTVCPNVEELTPDNIPGLLDEMARQEMIHLYTDERGRNLYQVVRWWEYQDLQWAQPSNFEPPANWIDRVRCQRRDVQTVQDWGKVGGFLDNGGGNTRPGAKDIPAEKPSGNPGGGPGGEPATDQAGLSTQLNSTQLKATQSKKTSTQSRTTQGETPDEPTKSQNLPAADAALRALLALPDMDEAVAQELLDQNEPGYCMAWAEYAASQDKLNNAAGYCVKGIRSKREPPAPRQKSPPRDKWLAQITTGPYADIIMH